jgi:hypothetical protein
MKNDVKLEVAIYRSTVEGPRISEDKLEEGNLPDHSLVFSEREHLDARSDTFSGPGHLLELEV